MSDDDYAAQQAEENNKAVMAAAMTSGAGAQVAKGMMDRMPAGGPPGMAGAPGAAAPSAPVPAPTPAQ